MSAPVKYIETNCDTPYGDRGNELDWLRQLWDVSSVITENRPVKIT